MLFTASLANMGKFVNISSRGAGGVIVVTPAGDYWSPGVVRVEAEASAC